MEALITVSHGSRHPRALGLVNELSSAAGDRARLRSYSSHLEFNEPSLPKVAERAVADGVTHATVVPLLFTRGYHIRVDLPAVVAEAARRAPDLDLELSGGLGVGEEMIELLTHRVEREVPQGAHLVVLSVGSSDTAANDSVRHLAQDLGARTGHTSEAMFATGRTDFSDHIHGHAAVHLLPLFVTHGLLLDQVTSTLGRTAAATSARITASGPLGTDLTDIVASRVAARVA